MLYRMKTSAGTNLRCKDRWVGGKFTSEGIKKSLIYKKKKKKQINTDTYLMFNSKKLLFFNFL